MVRTSAPGKLMLSGEYVVLEGAEALVTAVDRRLYAVGSARRDDGSPQRGSGSPGRGTLPPEALLAREYAEAVVGVTDMELTVDASALRRGDRKLGLGSSSAASAAAAAAVVAWHGGDPAARRPEILGWALAGHRAVAPQGSGADVAAATLGGVVRFSREHAERAVTIEWPHTLHVEVVWTGKPARTSDLVAQVKTLEADAPGRYREVMRRLRDASEELLGAIVGGEARRAIEAADEHGAAMGALGEAAGAPIVTETLARVAELARAHRGGAKPSGAGGGDVALAFFDSARDAARFRDACATNELALLPLELGADGVRLEET